MEKNKSSEDHPSSSVVMAETKLTSGSSETQPTLMFGSGATVGRIEMKSALFEFGNSPVKPDLSSGFNSADSTNDEDFFITREAVQSAIEVVDRGIQDEEEDKVWSDKSKEEGDICCEKEIENKDNSNKNVEGIVSNSSKTNETESDSYLSEENKEGIQQVGSDIKKDIPVLDKQDNKGVENLLQIENVDDDKLKNNISIDDKFLKSPSEKEESCLNDSECSETKNITTSGDIPEMLMDTTEEESKSDQSIKVKNDVDENNDNNQESETLNVVIVLSGTEQPENSCEVKAHEDLECISTNMNEDTCMDVSDKTCSDTLIVTQAIKDIKISPSVTKSYNSNPEAMDIDSHPSPPPKAEEFVEKTEDGNEIAITLENFEVSVFEEGSTDHLATGILELIKDENGKDLSIESKSTEIATKKEVDEFKLDEGVSSSEEDFDSGSSLKDTTAISDDSPKQEVDKDNIKDGVFKLDDGVISSCDENEEQVVHNTENKPNSDENLLNQTKETDTEVELMEVEEKVSDKELSILETKEPLVTSEVIDKKNSIEEDEINEISVEGESVSSKSSEENTRSKQDSVDKNNSESSEEKEDPSSKSVNNETEMAECLISESTDDNADKLQSEDELSDTSANADLIDLMRSALANNEEFRRNLSSELEEPSGDKEESDDGTKAADETTTKETEVISLVDDDDDESNRKKKPAAAIKCVNPNCMSGEGLDKTAMFVLTYFGLKRAKDQQVCEECFNMVMEHQEKLAGMLKEGKPLFSADFPSHRDVILLDSDEESISDNESELSEDTMKTIQDNLDDVIAESLANFGLDHQIRESCDYLNNMVDRLEDEASDLNKRFDEVQSTLDQFRKQIYKDYENPIEETGELHFTDCEIPPMPILKSKLQNQIYNRNLMSKMRKAQEERDAANSARQSSSATKTIATKKVGQVSQSTYENVTQDVIALHSEQRCDPPRSLPPPGPLVRPKLRVGDLAYTMKVSYFSIWVLCRVLEVIPRVATENDSSTETYRVRLENVKKTQARMVTGKYLAYHDPARVQLKVGTRVIAIFREEEELPGSKSNYYVGVIAEPPKSTNKYRYLVFFDDGYTQYCPHDNILVVCHTSRNVWEDIHPEPRDFIKNYLQQYPERPMVKMSRGQVVKVEWNGRWWIVRVLEVDASLVKVHFDADKRTEWIYRGSTRLGPMYQELAAAKERQSGSLLRSRGFGSTTHKSDMPYVEYTRGDGDEKKDEEKSEEPEEQPVVPTRSVARKSTAKKVPDPPVISNIPYTKPLVNHVPQGSVTQRKLNSPCTPIQFRPHQCNEACVRWTDYTPAAAKKYDPLIKPLMFGFSRLSVNYRGKSTIMYRAPCGRTIRNSQEMLCYLQGTKSALTIDLFDFDFWVNPLTRFEEGSTFGRIEDLSYGKENVPISCVNELDHCMPQYVQYMTAREPAKDVNLNLDPEFLVGCDCKDDCEDRSKCSCWQLTMQGKAYIPDGDLDPLFGYQYRRLPERIATGIYECNSKCKCSATCQNRVAQQPLSCRLQLFKTPKKGWGIRCLHDIPRGAFICIYAGFLLTEQEANEGGKTYGDEYLAELDYIESVENLKEGYETEAREPSDGEDDESNDTRTRFSSYVKDGYLKSSFTGKRTRNSRTAMDVEYEQEQQSGDSDLDVDGPDKHENIRLRLRRRTAEDGEKESSRKSKGDDDSISISDEETDSVRKPQTFNASIMENEEHESKYPSVRDMYGDDENVYIMDAKTHGNIGRYLNHSCSPNVFVQNVFVDTHDLRFPWVAFFANQYIPAGTELTWDYNYDVGSVPGKVMLCYCNSNNCRGRLL